MAAFVRDSCSDAFAYTVARPSPCARRAALAALVVAIGGSAMAFIDGSAVNVALPVLQANLGATTAGAQWVVEAYALFLSALILVGGSLGDHFGRRRVFSIGIAVFALSSIACALSQTIGQLIAARALQGIGGALLVPGSLALIGSSFSTGDRARAIGTWSGATAITAAIGPLLGGWLAEHASWRWIFALNLPLAVIVLVVAGLWAPESKDPQGSLLPLDWRGAAVVTLALGAIVFGLIYWQSPDANRQLVIAALATGVFAFGGFISLERREKAPMMPLSIFRSRNVAALNVLTLLLYAGMGGALFYVPFNLITVQGYSATAAGAALLPMIVLLALFSRWSGGLATRYGSRALVTVGPLIAGAGFLLFAMHGLGGTYWTTYFPAVIVLGVGMTLTVSPLTTAVMESVPMSHAGLVSGINNAVARTAGLVAIALFGLLLAMTFNQRISTQLDRAALPAPIRQTILAQRNKLAEITVPSHIPSETQARIHGAIDRSFVDGFRVVMIAAALLAFIAGGAGFMSRSAKK